MELAASAGLHLDPWQQLVLNDALGEGEDGKWSAFLACLCVPRQAGKGAVLEALELAGLFLFGEKLILHSAHEFKALDCATPVLTTGGWSTMGTLRDGDEVFAPDGQPTKVVAAHPVRHGRPCYRVTFDDGQEVVADAEHLWSVDEVLSPGRLVRRVLSTQQIVDAGISTVQPRAVRVRRTYRFRVDLAAPLFAPEVQLPLDPWLLGAWLGDGTRTKGELTVGAEDYAYLLERLDRLGETYRVRPDARWPDRVFTVIVRGLKDRLRVAGVLGAKHVPDVYLTASEGQRRELLAGIMDTDGTVSAHQIAVTMNNARLMDDVASLVRSLGYKATLREFRASLNGVDAGPMYRVQFTGSQSISPFGMPRKSAKLKPRQARVTRAHYNAIVAVEPVESRPTRCITVAHESSLYLAGRGFVPTHTTAREAFLRVLTLIDGTPELRKLVAPRGVRTSHGEEGIELRTGARLRFVARSTGSGRGFSGDRVILDEAYNLGADSMAALLPTLSARPNPQLWMTSSAGMVTSEVLHDVRKRGRAGTDSSLAYLEWSADPDDLDLDDPRVWAQANPALGIRISEEHIARERAALGDAEFARERLGVWDEVLGEQVIPVPVWLKAADPLSRISGKVMFALDVAPDRGSAAIAVAGVREDGRFHGEVVAARSGTGWVIPDAHQLTSRDRSLGLVVDDRGPAAALIPELQAAGVTVLTTNTRDMANACGQLFDAASADQFRHIDQPSLNAALTGARKRPLGDAWAWHRQSLSTDITPLVAVTLALFGFRRQVGIPGKTNRAVFL